MLTTLGIGQPNYGINITESYIYSVFDINNFIQNPLRISNLALSEIDIPFVSGFMDTVLITSHSSGDYSTVSKLYDQKGVSDLTSVKSLQPYITDALGNSLNYIYDYGENQNLSNSTTQELYDISKDFIIQYVMKNEVQPNNQRPNFTHQNSGGAIKIGYRPSGGNYIIGIANTIASSSAKRWVVFKPPNFALFTFTRIAGVYELYINNNLQTGDFVNENVGQVGNGIVIGYRSTQTSGKITDIQTLSAIYNEDLSSFDLSAYNLHYMAIHNIP